LQPVRRFALDAAILFSDILIVPYALGAKLWFEEGEGPRLNPVSDRGTFAGLRDRLDTKIVAPVYDAVARVRAALAPDRALIGFCGAPWTVATYLVAGRGSEDKREALNLAIRDRGLFQQIVDRLVETSAEHLLGQLQAGADAVQIFDTWAGSLDGEAFERWCLAPTRAIVDRVRAGVPKARIILFPKGVEMAGLEVLARNCKPNAIGLDHFSSRELARERLAPLCALQGNLDPEILLRGGEELDRQVDKIIASFRGERHIFNLGHGILPQTPIAHVERMVARVKGR
jgi:uroporphyrinogen decarboxylase